MFSNLSCVLSFFIKKKKMIGTRMQRYSPKYNKCLTQVWHLRWKYMCFLGSDCSCYRSLVGRISKENVEIASIIGVFANRGSSCKVLWESFREVLKKHVMTYWPAKGSIDTWASQKFVKKLFIVALVRISFNWQVQKTSFILLHILFFEF